MKLSRGQSFVMRYLLALVTVLSVSGLKLLLVPFITRDAPFLLYFLAVMVTAWNSGLGPAILATILAAFCNQYFFVQPFSKLEVNSVEQLARLIIFVIEALCIILICTKLRMARQRAEDNAREARLLERKILEISDAEQRRIGHDLHDGLGQHLTGIALMISQLANRLTSEKSPHAERAAKISSLAETAVEWTHDLTRSLSPAALETRGLAEGLAELAANAENIFGIRCIFEHDGDIPRCDLPATVHLYRIAQEAITNAVKHGHARQLHVLLSADDGQLRLHIADDGSGIQPSPQQDGMGLRIMQYRAKMIGATIDVQHGAGKPDQTGTIVICRYRALADNARGRIT